MRYAVVIEKAKNNYSAYVPDLPGCVTTGKTIEEIERNIKEAIEFHIEGLKEDGLPIPPQQRSANTWKPHPPHPNNKAVSRHTNHFTASLAK
jgi:predicted RNase H-like HicB family nuclease